MGLSTRMIAPKIRIVKRLGGTSEILLRRFSSREVATTRYLQCPGS